MAAPKPERLKAADVCQIAQVQPYVLRTWEAEFPDLGREVDGGPRFYGRADVERVLRIRDLVYGEGLTLSGARRRLEETATERPGGSGEEFSLVDAATRRRLQAVREGLMAVLAMLDRPAGGAAPFTLTDGAPAGGAKKAARKGRRS
ncbi:MAG: MerR family transcriptional regulator [Vicinamibacterales bacterium]